MQIAGKYPRDQQKVAELLGVGRGYVSQVINGRKPGKTFAILVELLHKEIFSKEAELKEDLSGWMQRSGMERQEIEDKCYQILGEITAQKRGEVNEVVDAILDSTANGNVSKSPPAPIEARQPRPVRGKKNQSARSKKKGK